MVQYLALTCSWGDLGVVPQVTGLPISGQPALPPEPQLPHCQKRDEETCDDLLVYNSMLEIKIRLSVYALHTHLCW